MHFYSLVLRDCIKYLLNKQQQKKKHFVFIIFKVLYYILHFDDAL